MMIPCYECKKPISTNAGWCQHCGAIRYASRTLNDNQVNMLLYIFPVALVICTFLIDWRYILVPIPLTALLAVLIYPPQHQIHKIAYYGGMIAITTLLLYFGHPYLALLVLPLSFGIRKLFFIKAQ